MKPSKPKPKTGVLGLLRMRLWQSVLFLAAFPALIILVATAAQYTIDWYTTQPGGTTSRGGAFAVTGTIGQPEAGTLSGGHFIVTGGFWAFAVVVETPGAPPLTITPSGPGQATISWTSGTTGWVLQETDSLENRDWTDVPGGRSTPIVVPAHFPARFYRLYQP